MEPNRNKVSREQNASSASATRSDLLSEDHSYHTRVFFLAIAQDLLQLADRLYIHPDMSETDVAPWSRWMAPSGEALSFAEIDQNAKINPIIDYGEYDKYAKEREEKIAKDLEGLEPIVFEDVDKDWKHVQDKKNRELVYRLWKEQQAKNDDDDGDEVRRKLNDDDRALIKGYGLSNKAETKRTLLTRRLCDFVDVCDEDEKIAVLLSFLARHMIELYYENVLEHALKNQKLAAVRELVRAGVYPDVKDLYEYLQDKKKDSESPFVNDKLHEMIKAIGTKSSNLTQFYRDPEVELIRIKRPLALTIGMIQLSQNMTDILAAPEEGTIREYMYDALEKAAFKRNMKAFRYLLHSNYEFDVAGISKYLIENNLGDFFEEMCYQAYPVCTEDNIKLAIKVNDGAILTAFVGNGGLSNVRNEDIVLMRRYDKFKVFREALNRKPMKQYPLMLPRDARYLNLDHEVNLDVKEDDVEEITKHPRTPDSNYAVNLEISLSKLNKVYVPLKEAGLKFSHLLWDTVGDFATDNLGGDSGDRQGEWAIIPVYPRFKRPAIVEIVSSFMSIIGAEGVEPMTGDKPNTWVMILFEELSFNDLIEVFEVSRWLDVRVIMETLSYFINLKLNELDNSTLRGLTSRALMLNVKVFLDRRRSKAAFNELIPQGGFSKGEI